MSAGQFYDLKFSSKPDGSICLTQKPGLDEPDTIYLHPAQLRHIAESFGLTTPSYRPDELTQLLAEQMGIIYKELSDECYRSHWLELTYAKLDGFMVALPSSVFPFHLWNDDKPTVPDAVAPKSPVDDQGDKSEPKTKAGVFAVKQPEQKGLL